MKDITFLEELEKRLNELVEEINELNKKTNSEVKSEPELHQLLGMINSEIELIKGPHNGQEYPGKGFFEPVCRLMDY